MVEESAYNARDPEGLIPGLGKIPWRGASDSLRIPGVE